MMMDIAGGIVIGGGVLILFDLLVTIIAVKLSDAEDDL